MTHHPPNPETEMFRTGEIVDERYRVIEEVGRGGYGTVFLAEELHPPHLFTQEHADIDASALRRVALKVFTRMHADEGRFKTEIEAMCRLEHPHIVPVFSFGRDRFSYLSMRYVDGIPLSDHEILAERFSIRERIEQLIHVSLALGHAHERRVVHRDLKPHNILVSQEGHAWVVDFGLAWLLNPDESTSRKVGTPGYLAPELIEATDFKPDHRADIYSLGATIHAAFAGGSPFRSEGMLGTVRRQLAGELTLHPALPAALDDLVMRCTHIDPNQRPRTAYDVADALRHILQRMTVPTPDIQSLSLDELPDERTDLEYLWVESIERTHHPRRGEGLRMRLRASLDQESIRAFIWFDRPGRAAQQAYESLKMIRRGMTIHLLDARVIENSRSERFIALDPRTLPILEPEIPIPVTDVARAQGVTSGHCPQRALLDWHAPRPFTRHLVEGGLAHDILEHLVMGGEDASSRTAFANAFVAGLKRRKLDCIAGKISDEDLRPLQEKMAQHFRHLHAWLTHVPSDRRVAEVQRLDARYGLEGRIDLVLEHDGAMDIIELKTGRYMADEHEQQVRAYGMMWARSAAQSSHRLRAQLVYSQLGKERAVNVLDRQGKVSLLHARNGIINALYNLAYGEENTDQDAPTPPPTPTYDAQPALCADRPCRFRRDTCAATQHLFDAQGTPAQRPALQAWYAHFDRLIAREYLAASKKMGEILTPGALQERIDHGKALRDADIQLIDEKQSVLHLRVNDAHIFQEGDHVVLHREDRDAQMHFAKVQQSDHDSLELHCLGAGTLRTAPRSGWVLDQRPMRIGFRDAWRGIYNVLRSGRLDVYQWLLHPPTTDDTPLPAPIDPGASTLNEEQCQAVALALEGEGPSIIQGPPGTGKTAVIAEVVAQLVSRGQRVLIATNTHAAADNVLARIIRRGVRSVLRVGGRSSVDPLVQRACEARGLDPDELFLSRVADNATNLSAIEATLFDTNVFVSTANAALRDPAFEILEQLDGRDAPGIQPIFDVALIDEASQLTEPLAAGIAVRAERVVLVGDDQQLPPVVVAKDAQAAAQPALPAALERSGLGGLDTSLFSRLRGRVPTVMLRRQYRMNRRIQAFPSVSFYAGELVAELGDKLLEIQDHALQEHTQEMQRRLAPNKPSVWVDVPHETTNKSRAHLAEAAEVAKTADAFLDALTRSGHALSTERVGVISPFRAQVRAIRAELRKRLGTQAKWIHVDTVERFQGRERDVMLLSLASPQWSSFVFDAQRLNVALTRARYKVVIFGPAELGTRMVEHFVPRDAHHTLQSPDATDDAPNAEDAAVAQRLSSAS